MPGLNPTQEDLEQFKAITQASHEDAVHFLSTGTTLQGAIEDYYAAQTAGATAPNPGQEDEEDEAALDAAITSNQDDTVPEENTQPPAPAAASRGGGVTLGGEPVTTALPKGWGKPEKKSGRIGEWTGGAPGRKEGGIATLFNTGVAGGPPPPATGDDDDDDEDADETKRRQGETFYAGGERSGLAIQNPNQPGAGGPAGGARGLVDNILRQAADNGANPNAQAAASTVRARNPFGGSGNTLGNEETPSSVIADPSAPPPSIRPPTRHGGLLNSLFGGGPPAPAEDDEEDVQTRHLTFWRDGFSIEDGPLMRYDEPGNKELLETIQAGRAPPHLFNVRYNQALQLEVAQRTTEEYRAPPKKPPKPFEGSGNRLGSPAPEIAESSTSSMPGGIRPQGILQGAGPSTSTSASTSVAAGGGQTKFEVDESKPTTSVQMRLGDGTRMVARVNLTHTVGDLRSFVSAARPDSRSFVLQTTFPSRELNDASETVEAAKLANAVVVQRYT